ncbi:hypothetical protein [Streptomyces sp. KL116D]|uniref:polyketide synthase dehydratase domain-containing protein n=1 Tax=Streptomyces sp. KL116D TaxID=3045152 RepID=UPI003556533D
MDPVAHPVLSTALETPDGGHVLTGRIVLGNQPWLADHAVGGRTLLPGSALVDLALTAGRHAGTPAVEELVLSAPLELGPATAVRVTVGAADPNGTRTVDVHARDASGPDTPWTRHATGVLGEDRGAARGPGRLAAAGRPPPRRRRRLRPPGRPGLRLRPPRSGRCAPPGSAATRCSPRAELPRRRRPPTGPVTRATRCTPSSSTRRRGRSA